MAAANAGDLSHAYVGYAPTLQKTVEYAAPVTKTIYQPSPVIAKTIYQPSYQPSTVVAKSVYEPEYNYHAYAPTAYAHAPAAYAHVPATYAHGTVSHYGKTIATPHSIVNKYDTRYISDDSHYKVAYPGAYSAAYPTVVKSPVVPAVVKSAVVPTVVKSYASPIVKTYDSFDHSYDHSYDHAYAHSAPVIAKAAVAYSPAVAVSHSSFESAHGHYSW